MSHLQERVAYLKGLSEGMGVTEESKKGKLLLGIIDALEDFADEMQHMQAEQESLEEYVESIDEDLGDVEDDLYELDEDEEIDYVEVECPTCDRKFYVEDEILYDDNSENDAIACPNCDELLDVDDLEIEYEETGHVCDCNDHVDTCTVFEEED
ncbi:hypothetical protein RH915_01730 [Serpentinicella sp. ANB-PHB4]|uniref:CD1247 N-terminal domain-containing protein n=1 Tax=Serpentinicella sp. ANB-PHB4 TaxID=3074076 RepID=UPI0028660833|nr:CD1247 N-terminal domain-containing protein [Serpentinicella sp. ANB-PHB4]MDR5658201.1 hypothetical protein [Serpentinicella sp. ANB-PHB4]